MANAYCKAVVPLKPDNPERKITMNTTSILTTTQVTKANFAVLEMMRERRFFLSEKHGLDNEAFSSCIEFDKAVRAIYKRNQIQTKKLIEEEEKALGVKPPVLKEGQSAVTCSLYTGGLEIQEIYPLEKFLCYMSENREDLYNELFAMYVGSVNDIPPSQLAEKEALVHGLVARIWPEIQALADMSDGVVLIQETRFCPTIQHGLEVMCERTEGLVTSPEGLAYLFYRNEREERLIDHHFVLFDTKHEGHSRVTHWSRENPTLSFRNRGGYDCPVKFVCVI